MPFFQGQSEDGSSDGYECPCQPEGVKHAWKSRDCKYVKFVTTGKRFGKGTPNESKVEAMRACLELPRWKSLKDKAQRSTSRTSSPAPVAGVSSNSTTGVPPVVGVTAIPCSPEGTDPQGVFSLTSPFPLRESIILDNGAATHVANNEALLTDLQPAAVDDYVLVGDSALKVASRGKRVMKKIVHGPDA